MASLSGDAKLVNVFRLGDDPHELTAKVLDIDRDAGKTMNYAIGYGAGPKRLAQTLTVAGFPTTFGEAKAYLAEVKSFYPRLFKWMDHVMWEAKQHGGVNTIGGRRRRLSETFESKTWKEVMYGERQAVNFVVQGSAADVFRRALLVIQERIPEWRLLAQVHDEALWEYDTRPTKELLASAQALMENSHGYSLRVPLVFKPQICFDWSQKGDTSVVVENAS